MKINFIVHSLDQTNMGGVLKVITDLANSFVKENINVCIYSLGKIENICFEILPQVNIVSLGLEKHSTIQYNGYRKINWFIECFNIFKKIIKENKNEIWLPTSPPLNLLFSTLKLKKPKIKIIGCDHTSTVYSKGFILDKFKYLLLKKINYMIALTEEDKNFYIKKGIKSLVISNPIDLKSIVIQKSNKKNIIFVGRFSKEKQPVAALKLFYNSGLWKNDIKFKMYGDGPLDKELTDFVKINNLENHVAIINNERNPDIIYKDVNFLLMTSKVEGFGMVLLEAISRNIPCISFNVPYGPRNIIKDGVNGFFIDGSDKDFLKKVNLINKLEIANINKTVEEFDINLVVKKYLNLFEVV